MSGNRSVSLPTADLEELKAYADELGVTLTAWILAAAREKRARQSAAGFAEFVSDPEVAKQLDAWHAHTDTLRATEWGRLHNGDQLGKAA